MLLGMVRLLFRGSDRLWGDALRLGITAFAGRKMKGSDA